MFSIKYLLLDFCCIFTKRFLHRIKKDDDYELKSVPLLMEMLQPLHHFYS